MRKPLLIVISFLLFLPNLFKTDFYPEPVYNHIEDYDASLSRINTIDKLAQFTDSIADAHSVRPQTLDYVEIIATIIRKKFYHGYSHFLLNENWIAAVSGKLIWQDLSCKVQPNGIIKNNYAACSQQELVVMSLLRRKNISYRSVLFPHHYALEALIQVNWYYFDTNMEPKINKEERLETNWKSSVDTLKKYYDTSRYKNLDYTFGKNIPLKFGPINEIPAPKARIFELATLVFSKSLWCFPLLFIFCGVRKSKMRTNFYRR